MGRGTSFGWKGKGKSENVWEAKWKGRYGKWFFGFHKKVCLNPHGTGTRLKRRGKK